MALISKTSIDAVIDASDMLEIVAPYTTLKKTGSNFMGKCPFHQEKTPSFSVDSAQKVYHCFGCGESGNLFTFIEKKEGLGFIEAVKFLADKYGVKLVYEESSPEQEKKRQQRERLYQLLDQTATYYTRYLWQSPAAEPARRYLKKRGFTEEVAKKFRLGYSPAGGTSLTKAALGRDFKPGELLQAGLALEREGKLYDRFRGRLMFPFTDHRGRILGFGARVLDRGKPKYLNSPESEIYHKGNLVFGLANARQSITKEDRVYIVEGYTDVLALNQAGIDNAVASMGTALTANQLKEISRFSKNVYLAFDADAAGRKAMLNALKLSRELSVFIKVTEMPGGKDPADLVMASGGGEAFRKFADDALTLLQYQVRATLSGSDFTSSEGRFRAETDAVRQVLAYAANAEERNEQLRIIADRFGLSGKDMAYLVKSAISRKPGENGEEMRRRVLSREETVEKTFLSLCLAHPDEAGRYLKELKEDHFTDGVRRSAFNLVCEKMTAQEGGLEKSGLATTGETGASNIFPELIIRAETEDSSPGALPELYFRLLEAELSRRINVLKARLSDGEDTSQEIHSLEKRRRKILELIQAGTFETV